MRLPLILIIVLSINFTQLECFDRFNSHENKEYLSKQPLAENDLDDDIVEILLKYGGDPSFVIFQAARIGDIDSVKKLIEFGIDPSEVVNGHNIVDAACNGNNIVILKYLIEEIKLSPTHNPFNALIFQNPPFFEAIDYFLSLGYTFPEEIIIYTAYSQKANIETLEFLISRGVNLTCLTDPKFSNLTKHLLDVLFRGSNDAKNLVCVGIYKKVNPDLSLFYLLLLCGLDVNKEISFVKSINPYYGPHGYPKKDVFGTYNTPLLVAISNNDFELVKKLVDRGAKVNFEGKELVVYLKSTYNEKTYHNNNPHNISPLKLAINIDSKEIVKILLKNGAEISPRKK
jgi:ankyrin repeat protein